MKNLLKTTTLLFVSFIIFSCGKQEEGKATTSNNKIYRWKLAQTWGPTLPIFTEVTNNFSSMVKEMSNNRLQIDIVPSTIHKAPLGVFDLVKTGQYEMGHSASYYWKGKDFKTNFFTTTPFGMIAVEQYAWFYYGGGMELMKKVYDQYDMLSFPGGNTGNQMGGWFRKEINSLDDLKGLKMRIPGFAGEVFAKLGVSTVNIPAGELYTSLERGTIDALEWVGPGMDLKMGFQKIAPYYYSGWHEPASEMQYLINKSAFETLPQDLKTILQTAMKVTAYNMLIKSYHENAIALSEIQEKYPNVELKTFPKEVIDSLKNATNEILEEKENSGDDLLKEIIISRREYLKKSREWTNISDLYYLENK